MAKPAPGDVLSDRVLNRSLLARQLLLQRERIGVFEVIDRLVGMQAQEPKNPYVGLWSRIKGFEPSELETLLLERKVTRTPIMRSTVHLATAEDAIGIRPLVQPLLERVFKGNFAKQLAGSDIQALAGEATALLSKDALTFAQLRNRLSEEWSQYPNMAIGYSISYLVPLVQIPPRGLWHKSGQATWMTTEAWLGRPVEAAPVDEVVLRYLKAFGPATPADVRTWCGIAALREVIEGLRPRLVSYRGEDGRELLDVPGAPFPPVDTPRRRKSASCRSTTTCSCRTQSGDASSRTRTSCRHSRRTAS
jgi:hypothetical protein